MTGLDPKGFALWLMPEGEVYRRLSDLIDRLSARFATPRFEPHVTLLGGLTDPEEDVLSKSARLARLIRPMTLRLRTTGHRDEYFRCLFFEVDTSPNLMAAHSHARELFGKVDEPPYSPHLSLMYGRLSAEQSQRILEEIGTGFTGAFDVRALDVCSTAGEVQVWHCVGKFPLAD